MNDTPTVPQRPGTLQIELSVPDHQLVTQVLGSWGFRYFFELKKPQPCVWLTDGFFNWTIFEERGLAEVRLCYLTPDWAAWLATVAPDMARRCNEEADPDWGVCFEVAPRTNIQVQAVNHEVFPPRAHASLLGGGRFAELSLVTPVLHDILPPWNEFGFHVVHQSQAPEPEHVLLYDGLVLVGLYAGEDWAEPTLVFYSEEPAYNIEQSKRFGLVTEELENGAWRVWLPGELPVLWVPEYRTVEGWSYGIDR